MSTTIDRAGRSPRRKRGLSGRWWRFVPVGMVLGLAIAWWIVPGRGAAETDAGVPAPRRAGSALPQVEVIRPKKGGIERLTIQPGSVHPFESVDLHSMVSGYLEEQSVDIGSRVTKGQVLARIAVPREQHAVAEARALLEQTKARALQAVARVKATEADRDTATATLRQTESDVDRLVAARTLAGSSYGRIKNIHERNAVPRSVVDEHKSALESAVAAEKTARLGVETARARLAGAEAKVEQSRADVAEANAAVGVAQAQLGKAQVDLDYSKITAPFDGVITRRNYHPGAFIRSGVDATQLPLLTVIRTDLMRVIVRVPDRDVVLTNAGDPAAVTVDGLNGRSFEGSVSRVAECEDHTTRTMRIEIDIPNPDGLLREGMYGLARIGLEPVSSKRLTIPATCVAERSGKNQGVVQVVRNGKVDRVSVELGADNGSLVEIDSGLKLDDDVVLRSTTPLERGMPVAVKVSG